MDFRDGISCNIDRPVPMVFCGWQRAIGTSITSKISGFKPQYADQRVLTNGEWRINVPDVD